MRKMAGLGLALVLLASSLAGIAQGQAPEPGSKALTEAQMADTQQELFKLLRGSPVMTSVIERDPSLLTDQAYVSRNNPALADFLVAHPEVSRNPDYYLFTGMGGRRGGGRLPAFEHKVWPEQTPGDSVAPAEMVLRSMTPTLLFLCVLGALIWLIRLFVENRRWSRAIKLQMETHSKLIDRFTTNQELMVYMETEAGKRFLEAGPAPVDFAQSAGFPSAMTRVLMPLQIGIVMTLLGAGLLGLRHSIRQAEGVLLVMGVVVLMPGLGFIISAGLTWLLAGRLGLMPDASKSDVQDRV